jgi:putative transposase
MKKYGLEQKKKKRFTKTTNSHHALRTFPNRIAGITALYPHHIWASDITYVRLERGFCYAALIIDLFTRKVVGWAVENHMEKELVLYALESALQKGIPSFHHSDRGGQYCSKEYVQRLKTLGVTISMADPGMSVDNPFAESMNKTLKTEEVYLREYCDVDEARMSIGDFLENVYNTKRLHSSLGYVPPMEFERNWHEAQGRHQELMCA